MRHAPFAIGPAERDAWLRLHPEPWDEKTEKEYADKAASHFKKSLPYLERAYELKKDDQKLLEILGGVYNRLRMEDKAREIEKRLSDVSGDSE